MTTKGPRKGRRRMYDFAEGDWRQDGGIVRSIKCTRRFAYLPKRLTNKTWVWLTVFYKHQEFYSHKLISCDDSFFGRNIHPEKPTYIDSEEYMVKKLCGDV